MKPEYDWILNDKIWLKALDDRGEYILAVKDNHRQAVVLSSFDDPWSASFAPDTVITFNGEAVGLPKNEMRQVLGIIEIAAREGRGGPVLLEAGEVVTFPDGCPSEEAGYFMPMTCGHEMEYAQPLPYGTVVRCVEHGIVRVTE